MKCPSAVAAALLPVVLVACGGSTRPAAPAVAPAPTTAPSAPDTASASAPLPLDAGGDIDAGVTPAPVDAGATPSPSGDDSSNDAAGVAYLEAIQVVYKANRDRLTATCWLHAKSSERAYAGKALIRVGSAGKLVSTKTDGTDDATSACIDKQIKKWKLPPPSGTATVTLPIRLHRD